MAQLLPSQRPTITVGGMVFVNLSNLIILTGIGTTNANYSTLRSGNASAGYQVTNGKTLTQWAAELIGAALGATAYGNLNYGDNDVGLDTATVPTNPIHYGGSSAIRAVALAASASGTGYYSAPANLKFNCLSQKYPSFYFANGAASVKTYGYEQ